MGGRDKRYRYARSYRETIALKDGERALLRHVRPSDKQLLVEAFERLSKQSRYSRFMAAKAQLTEGELQYLTEVDGIDHFAVAAVRRHFWSKDEVIGVARFVRLNDQHDTAEPAITVVDDYHRKGLGSILLQRLTEAAWERDIRWFYVEVLADNLASRRLFGALDPDVRFRLSGGGGMAAMLPVPEPSQTLTPPGLLVGSPVHQLFSYLARASMPVGPRVARPSEPPPV